MEGQLKDTKEKKKKIRGMKTTRTSSSHKDRHQEEEVFLVALSLFFLFSHTQKVWFLSMPVHVCPWRFRRRLSFFIQTFQQTLPNFPNFRVSSPYAVSQPGATLLAVTLCSCSRTFRGKPVLRDTQRDTDLMLRRRADLFFPTIVASHFDVRRFRHVDEIYL